MNRGDRTGNNNMKKILITITIVIITLISCGKPHEAPAGETTTYSVVLVNDPRLPSVSEDKIKLALELASQWIEKWYGKKTVFRIARHDDIDLYINAHLQDPPLPQEWLGIPYALDGTDNIERFISHQEKNLQKLPMEDFMAYTSDSLKHQLEKKENRALILLRLYEEKIRKWRELKSDHGIPYLDAGEPRKHSLWYWHRVFKGMWPEAVKDNLILTNVMLIDDALQDLPPHTLITGGLANGLAIEEMPQSVISTFLIFSGDPEIDKMRVTRLSDDDQILSLARVIAHEFGAHIIQGWWDAYNHTGCLAEPTPGLEYKKALSRLFDNPVCKLEHRPLNPNETMAGRYEEIFARYVAVEKYNLAKKALRRVKDIDPHRPDLKENLETLEEYIKR